MRVYSKASVLIAALLSCGISVSGAQTTKKDKPSASKATTTQASNPATAPGSTTGAKGIVGAVAPLPRVYAPTRPREVAPKYPWRRNIPTTIFWIGESPSENNPTPNHASSWDVNWQLNYGGFDDPNKDNRTWDFRPKAFTPGLNPFYIALPFNDLTCPEVAKLIPWYKKRKAEGAKSVCQSMWVAVRFGNKTCFAQWEDCGPFTTEDHNYVFGGKPPATKGNGGAGLDISPAVRDFLGASSGALCDWRFCTEEEVTDGPWKRFGKNNTFLSKDQRENEALRKRYEELVRRREEWLKKQATQVSVRVQ
ncbi:MAG TPA: hypothetical protein VG796_23385 [Verrucomicrobiales bacterium]|jgi:hypothetical protein|nr:hypothetical protein [Verrucomicrobiales bacterium]